ncbi:hypothetical protein [Sulfuricurvum sp.]|uniref:hypothetical protein n=1 Tax=Sulfuricurvum sp. TaxID=2025608 RepID=UPI00262BDA58|nr:hypothetical protein [Sulfuricurvum sp.]MDD2267910.1 hypothetical protein [Sulfuricurvum sp.]MDD2785165.1 hypothetical protein [Sulfuricurvum sp.]
MMEEIRVLTIGDLKQEIRENIEYAHPDKNPTMVNGYGVAYGFKPIVDEKFFETEDEAVTYIFQTNELYKDIKALENTIQVTESYDEDTDSLFYKRYTKESLMTLSLELFSAKLGHNDIYEFSFEETMLTIFNSHNGKKVTCTFVGNNDVMWTGEESIEHIFTSNSIIYPENIRGIFEYLWLSLKTGKIEKHQASEELESLINWINAMTRTRPSSEFWNQ